MSLSRWLTGWKLVGQEMKRAGVMGSIKKIINFNIIKSGTLIGQDEFGNKYFENKAQPYGQDRWVELAGSEFNATEIPPHWHSWLHHINEKKGLETRQKYEKMWAREHIPNQTGTDWAYKPHNYLRKKSWEPRKEGSPPALDLSDPFKPKEIAEQLRPHDERVFKS